MHVLFIHRAFPAQFGRLALELARQHGWKCSVLVEKLSSCPTPSPEMLAQVELHRLQLPAESQTPPPWPQSFGHSLEIGRAVFEAVRSRPQLRPDLVVAHGGLTPTLFLREVMRCPLIDYCEYYFAPNHRDLTYRLDLPPPEVAPFFPRCINGPTLINLAACDAGYAPTEWQRRSFPERFWPKIEVHFDGIDTDLYRPRAVPRVAGGRTIPEGTRVVTYVARGLESMRGFDIFMEVARRIALARSDVLFLIAGDEGIYYGWDRLHTGQPSFKQWVLERGSFDLSRFVFLGHLPPEELSAVLCLSDLHIYLTVPFVLSWSLFNALASGCVVLASDVPPVREVIQAGENGLLEPLFDAERLSETALRVLNDPGEYRSLGQQARTLLEEKYSVEAAVPPLKAFFQRVARQPRR
jgi:glycosyltransferase involved in cell wall biosynthesis